MSKFYRTANVYNVGSYYSSRGSNRNLRADYIVSSIKKEIDKKIS